MYQLRIKDPASDSLSKLDKRTARRIVAEITWLAHNADTVEPIGLHGRLSGLAKVRVGDYRIIYQLVKTEKVLVIHDIGHRCEICKGQ